MEEAQYRCGYCLTSQRMTTMPMHIEHLLPLAADGVSEEENLWPACPLGNALKGPRPHYPDPETREAAPLCNPCRQQFSLSHRLQTLPQHLRVCQRIRTSLPASRCLAAASPAERLNPALPGGQSI